MNEAEAPEARLTGRCACGEVGYEIRGALHNTVSCHCSNCRKIFNAQASAVGGIKHDQLTWLKGEDQLTSFVSKQGWGVQFCKLCGSTVCTTYEGKVIQITLGCLEGDPVLEIERHIHVDSKARWEVMPENVTQFPGAPPASQE